MMPVGELFVHVYVLVDDALAEGRLPVPPRPGPALGGGRARAGGSGRAAVDGGAAAEGLLEGAAPAGLLLDRGVVRRAWAAEHERRGTRVVYAHSRADRRRLPAAVRRPVAKL